MKKHNFSVSKKGFLLPTAIIFVLISVILGLGILYIGELELIGANRRLDREKAFYLAEAGLNRAFTRLQDNPGWRPEEEPVSLGDGTFYIELDNSVPGRIVLDSTGEFREASETIQLTLLEASTQDGGPSIFANGIFGANKLTLEGSSQILGYDSRDGSSQYAYAGSNLEINLGWSTKISGDAWVTPDGDIIYQAKGMPWAPNPVERYEIYDGETVDFYDEENLIEYPDDPLPGYTQPFDPRIEVPQTAVDGGRHAVESEGIFNVGFWPVISATINSGTYHFKEFNITGNRTVTIEGKVVMYIENDFFKTSGQGHIVFGENATLTVYLLSPNGKINIAGSSTINADGSPADLGIYSTSSMPINLTGNVQVFGAIYAPWSTVNIAGSSPLRGGLVADTVKLTGNVKIYFDAALREISPPGAPGSSSGLSELTIIRWTKPGWSKRLQ